MSKYQVIKVDIGETFETDNLIEAAQAVSLAKRELEEAGYTNVQIVFRVLNEAGVEEFGELHRYENGQWKNVVVTQKSQTIDVKDKPIQSSKEISNKDGLTQEKIYYNAKFAHQDRPPYQLFTNTFLSCNKTVETFYIAEFGGEKFKISKQEYEFLLKTLEEKQR